MLYMIMSRLTKQPFIDEKRNAYVFRKKEEAEAFASEIRDTKVRETEKDAGQSVFSECFAAGAKTLRERSGDREVTHDLSEEEMDKRFYNGALNANVARYLHTHNLEYLRAVKNCRFIVPIRITNEPYTKIVYATLYRNTDAKNKRQYVFIAFSDLEEYEKWTERENGWKPLLIDNYVMSRIGRRHGFILDIYRTGFYISGKLVRRYIFPEEENND